MAVSKNLEFKKIDYKRKSICFNVTEPGNCEFEIEIGDKKDILINPVFELKGWGTNKPESVSLNGTDLDPSSYRYDINDNNLLIWIKAEFDKNTQFTIK